MSAATPTPVDYLKFSRLEGCAIAEAIAAYDQATRPANERF